MPDTFGIGQTCASVVNGGFGLIGANLQAKHNMELAKYNNKEAAAREAMARAGNYKYGEMAAENADARTRALYEDLYSLPAQMRMAREAGLSPSLFASGISGMQGQQGAMGTGASGVTPEVFGAQPADIIGAISSAAQVANLNADTAKKKEETKGQKIKNADDPVISKYIVEKQQSIENANAEEAQIINNAFAGLQSQLTQINVFSKGTTFSISHGEGESESESQSWNFNVHNANGQTNSFTIGGSLGGGINIGLTGGGANGNVSGNYGKSEGSNTAHGEGHGESEGHAWAKHILDSLSKGENQSGNKREAENVLAIFYNQCTEAITRFNDTRTNAREKYEFQVWRYEKNLGKHKK